MYVFFPIYPTHESTFVHEDMFSWQTYCRRWKLDCLQKRFHRQSCPRWGNIYDVNGEKLIILVRGALSLRFGRIYSAMKILSFSILRWVPEHSTSTIFHNAANTWSVPRDATGLKKAQLSPSLRWCSRGYRVYMRKSWGCVIKNSCVVPSFYDYKKKLRVYDCLFLEMQNIGMVLKDYRRVKYIFTNQQNYILLYCLYYNEIGIFYL